MQQRSNGKYNEKIDKTAVGIESMGINRENSVANVEKIRQVFGSLSMDRDDGDALSKRFHE